MSRSIVLAIDVASTPDAVHSAIASTDGLASFWTSSVSGSTDVGGDLSFGFEAAPVPLQMTVSATEAAKLVEWECGGPWPNWGGTRVSWATAPSDNGTMVVFRHDGWVPDVTDAELGSVALTWAMTLQALKAFGETGIAAPALG